MFCIKPTQILRKTGQVKLVDTHFSGRLVVRRGKQPGFFPSSCIDVSKTGEGDAGEQG